MHQVQHSSLGPFFGWLADVKLGRYKVIIYGTLALFVASILASVGLLAGGMFGEVLFFVGNIMDGLCTICFLAAMLPFMTDQLIGATADELSSVVYWYYWFHNLSIGLTVCIMCTVRSYNFSALYFLTIPCATCLTMIVISDCLCCQSLDRTHKVTNPIKLIIQVLNYARKNKYPQRRSAFTYLDEEQPSRLDFGKEKFGGPFTEEEVEDVKTALQLLPLVAYISIGVTVQWPIIRIGVVKNSWPYYAYPNCVLDTGIPSWISPFLFIPLYQFLFYPLLHKWVPSMLRRIGAGLFLKLVGFALCAVSLVQCHYDAHILWHCQCFC